jgi:hypothetical protein
MKIFVHMPGAFNAFYGECLRTARLLPRRLLLWFGFEDEEAEKKNIIAGINKKSRRMLRTFRSSLALSLGNCATGRISFFSSPFALNLSAFFARFFCVSG